MPKPKKDLKKEVKILEEDIFKLENDNRALKKILRSLSTATEAKEKKEELEGLEEMLEKL